MSLKYPAKTRKEKTERHPAGSRVGGMTMVTVKRKKRRSLENPTARYLLFGGIALGLVVLALCVFGLTRSFRLEAQLEDLGDYIAKSIRTGGIKMDDAIIEYVKREFNMLIGDRTAEDVKFDLGAALQMNMKRFMYSAYTMNRLLVAARGDSYSILDSATYNNFQTIVGEYERLLANGQSTTEVKTSLGDYMSAIGTMLSERFDSADLLLPQTALQKSR